MAFLDFIKNRGEQRPASEQQSQQAKPETAREMYSREATQEKQSAPRVATMPDADKSQAKDLGARIDAATQNIQPDTPPPTPEPGGTAARPEPMRQNMDGQDVTAPSLSPTSGQVGAPSTEQDVAANKQESPTQEQSARPKTMARTAPSWER